jgi:hypothetical protein
MCDHKGEPSRGTLTNSQTIPQKKYLRCGDLSLACQVVGESQINLGVASSFISHIELGSTVPEVKA